MPIKSNIKNFDAQVSMSTAVRFYVSVKQANITYIKGFHMILERPSPAKVMKIAEKSCICATKLFDGLGVQAKLLDTKIALCHEMCIDILLCSTPHQFWHKRCLGTNLPNEQRLAKFNLCSTELPLCPH